MSVSPRAYVTINPYVSPAPPPPADALSYQRYVLRQLKNIQATLTDLQEAAVQTLDQAPVKAPRFGTIRFAIGTWATALGGEGWYGYSDASGGTWKLIKAA